MKILIWLLCEIMPMMYLKHSILKERKQTNKEYIVQNAVKNP